MEHKFEWNKEKRELMEYRTGTNLVNNKQEKVEGSFENKTYYPEVTARAMITELERQLMDATVQNKAMAKQIVELEKKIKPVDSAFYAKYQSCQAKDGIEKQKEPLEQSNVQILELSKQLKEIKDAMGEDLTKQ